jgi:hypothetical protein
MHVERWRYGVSFANSLQPFELTQSSIEVSLQYCFVPQQTIQLWCVGDVRPKRLDFYPIGIDESLLLAETFKSIYSLMENLEKH